MPNMRLTKVDVNALIEYLRAESRRVERARQNGEVVNAGYHKKKGSVMHVTDPWC